MHGERMGSVMLIDHAEDELYHRSRQQEVERAIVAFVPQKAQRDRATRVQVGMSGKDPRASVGCWRRVIMCDRRNRSISAAPTASGATRGISDASATMVDPLSKRVEAYELSEAVTSKAWGAAKTLDIIVHSE